MTINTTTPLTYNGYVAQIATLAIYQTTTVAGVVTPSDAFFLALIPQMLNYAELRIQRDVDLLALETSNQNYTTSIGVNIIPVSQDDFITIQTIAYVSGSQTLQVLPVSKNFIQNVYPDSSFTGPPAFWAVYGGDQTTSAGGEYPANQNILFGPAPNLAYPLVLTGTTRIPSLNTYATTGPAATNTTFISTYLPDLLIIASMVYLSGAQRNFGRASDDPQMAVTYESQYQALLAGAKSENYRARWQAAAWSSASQPPAATAAR